MVNDIILNQMFHGIWASDFFHFILIMILAIGVSHLYERINKLEAQINNTKVKKINLVKFLLWFAGFLILAIILSRFPW